MATEKQIEKKLKKMIEDFGGICYKFMSPGRTSVPDRLCVLPKGVTYFVECKGDEGELTSAQQRELVRLKELGHNAYVIYNFEQVMLLKSLIKEDLNANL